MRNPTKSLALALATTVLVAACSSGSASNAPSATPAASAGAVNCVAGSITPAGSTALQPLVQAAATAYVAACPAATISVQGGGSGTGLTDVLQGTVQIGNSDIFAEEKFQPSDSSQLVDHQVAIEGFVMITHTDVTGVTNLTTQQAVDIWTGKTTNWNQVGGPDLPIVLILRPASSGTRSTFKRIVLGGVDEASGTLTEDSNGTVAQIVSTTPGATSYVGFSFYESNTAGLNALQLDGVAASVDNMANGTYKLQTIGHMYTKGPGDPLSQAFIAYMLTPDVQNGTVKSLFYGPIGTTIYKSPVSAPPPAASPTAAPSAS